MYEENYLAQRLRQNTLNADDKTFLTNSKTGAQKSFGAFFANTEKVAAALVATGLEKGDRVAVQAPKTEAMLELYIATVLVGAIFLPLNTAYTSSEIEYFLGDAKPRVLVCDPSRLDTLAPIAQGAGVKSVLTLAADETGTLTEARDQQSAGFIPVPCGADDLAAILYTSGTTGRSKGAMLTHKALASNSEALRDCWQFTEDDVLIHALPIFHTHGLFVATNVTLMAGASCIFFGGFDAPAIVKHMPEATVLMGVPTFYVRLLSEDGLADAAQNMRLFVSGSAPLLAETHQKWQAKTGHAILERYGMTETNMNLSNPYDGERRAGTVGFPIPGVEVKITNPDNGEDVTQGSVGMIEVRGPNVFAGYWRMLEKTAEELREDGFFITGDLGMQDEDGYFHIVGRNKDLIISGGYNVYPKEVEMVIDDLSGVVESAVFGVPHPDFGEGVVALVIAEDDAELDTDWIAQSLSGSLAKFKQPKAILIAKELPRNAMGKVQKNLLRETYKDLFSG